MTTPLVTIMATAAVRRLDGMAERAAGRSTGSLIAELLQEYEKAVYATGNFGKWRPLSAQTIAQKGSSRVLVETGHLMRDLTAQPDVTLDDVSLFTGLPYAKFLKAGRYNPETGARVPKRNPVPGPTKRVRAMWAELLAKHIAEGTS